MALSCCQHRLTVVLPLFAPLCASPQHPWVTLGGSAPLVSIIQQAGSAGCGPAGLSSSSGGLGGVLEASQEEIDAAIQQIASGGVSELMDVVFEERVLLPG